MPKWDADVSVTGMRAGAPVNWHVPEEAPVALVYNGVTHAVMLASPADLHDFGIGFTVTEGIAGSAADIKSVDVREKEQGIDLMITLEGRAFERFSLRRDRRNLVGRTGCGLCGIDSMEQLYAIIKPVADTPVLLDAGAVAAAADTLPDLQTLKKLNRSVHGAAWVKADGTIMLVREDVGRHNALDKLLGALSTTGADFSGGFVLVSSRASYEMVQKCVAVGVKALVCLSSPTAFAIRLAREANFTVANWSGDGLVTF